MHSTTCVLVSLCLLLHSALDDLGYLVIQGASDMGARLTEMELQKSLDFCVKLFNPTTPEEHERLARSGHVARELLDASGPFVDPSMFEYLPIGQSEDHSETEAEEAGAFRGGECDSDSDNSDCEKAKETRRVLDKINARRLVHAEYAIHNLELEPLEQGYVVRLEKGRLGLVMLEVPSSGSGSDSGSFSCSSSSSSSFEFFDDEEVN